MKPIHSISLSTEYGQKNISVYSCNILDFDEPIDILTTSAFRHSYYPTPKTMFHALDTAGISVMKLAENPAIDLRNPCGVWLSEPVSETFLPIKRIGCVEMTSYFALPGDNRKTEQSMLNAIKTYFQMLDIASSYDIPVASVAMPLLGGGLQNISSDLTMIPLINECIAFLKRNPSSKKISLIEYNPVNAYKFALALEKSYAVYKERSQGNPCPVTSHELRNSMAFLSYSSKDRNIADNLCAKLEARGLKVWYAPRNIHNNDYASAIVSAIDQCTHFIVLLSKNSMESEHVLNEIDLAFRVMKKIRFLPLRIDSEEMAPAFSYYLSRQHWMDACPPIEEKLEEFAINILSELKA